MLMAYMHLLDYVKTKRQAFKILTNIWVFKNNEIKSQRYFVSYSINHCEREIIYMYSVITCVYNMENTFYL